MKFKGHGHCDVGAEAPEGTTDGKSRMAPGATGIDEVQGEIYGAGLWSTVGKNSRGSVASA